MPLCCASHALAVDAPNHVAHKRCLLRNVLQAWRVMTGCGSKKGKNDQPARKKEMKPSLSESNTSLESCSSAGRGVMQQRWAC